MVESVSNKDVQEGYWITDMLASGQKQACDLNASSSATFRKAPCIEYASSPLL
jgi:hypothetical protein